MSNEHAIGIIANNALVGEDSNDYETALWQILTLSNPELFRAGPLRIIEYDDEILERLIERSRYSYLNEFRNFLLQKQTSFWYYFVTHPSFVYKNIPMQTYNRVEYLKGGKQLEEIFEEMIRDVELTISNASDGYRNGNDYGLFILDVFSSKENPDTLTLQTALQILPNL